VVNSMGFETARDAWVYNFSQKILLDNIKKMIEFFNTQIGKPEPDYDPAKISWTRSLLGYHKNKQAIAYDCKKAMAGLYRPYCKQQLYYGERVINVRGQFDMFYPTPDTQNLLIIVSGIGVTKDWSVIIANTIADIQLLANGQCFPLYYYEEKAQTGKTTGPIGQMRLDGTSIEAELIRKSGISDFILYEARARYGAAVKREDIFFYVYGYLHNPKYRAAFADDLKKSLPRIQLVEKPEDFWAFSKAGRGLAKLHLEYKGVPPLPEVAVSGDTAKLHVTKMRFKSKEEKGTIIFNENITVSNIPARAYEYVVNGKSAVEWVMERYQVKTDKDSGILNDPNLYAEETGRPKYILDLLMSVIAVSVRTMDIVEALPEVQW